MKEKFTVVLLRPAYLANDYGKDIYVAHVEATDKSAALAEARSEVFETDTKDGLDPSLRADYALCVMFEGHVEPVAFGWGE